jgi:hypothetical protein
MFLVFLTLILPFRLLPIMPLILSTAAISIPFPSCPFFYASPDILLEWSF